jgi:hypothetical protein
MVLDPGDSTPAACVPGFPFCPELGVDALVRPVQLERVALAITTARMARRLKISFLRNKEPLLRGVCVAALAGARLELRACFFMARTV